LCHTTDTLQFREEIIVRRYQIMLNHIAGEQYQSDFTDEVDPIPW
jgi:hypothetical protein